MEEKIGIENIKETEDNKLALEIIDLIGWILTKNQEIQSNILKIKNEKHPEAKLKNILRLENERKQLWLNFKNFYQPLIAKGKEHFAPTTKEKSKMLELLTLVQKKIHVLDHAIATFRVSEFLNSEEATKIISETIR